MQSQYYDIYKSLWFKFRNRMAAQKEDEIEVRTRKEKKRTNRKAYAKASKKHGNTLSRK